MKTNERPRIWKCRLAAMREASGLSLRDLEEATGVNNVTVSMAERGMEVKLETAVLLARFFCVPVEEIWTGFEGEK